MNDARTMERLPPGRHGLSPDLVERSQRSRLTLAATESLVARGYGAITITEVTKRAGVSTATFYKRFDDLWDCLLAAYEAAATRLCDRIEDTCAAAGGGEEGGPAAIEGGLTLLASEPGLAHLLSADPPSQATALWEARRRLIVRLGGLLREAREQRDADGTEERLIGGALALVSTRARTEGAEQLKGLTSTLTEILLAP